MREYIHALVRPPEEVGPEKRADALEVRMRLTADALASSRNGRQTIEDLFLSERFPDDHVHFKEGADPRHVTAASVVPGPFRRIRNPKHLFLVSRAFSRYSRKRFQGLYSEAQEIAHERRDRNPWTALRSAVLGLAYHDLLSKKQAVMGVSDPEAVHREVIEVMRRNPDEFISRMQEFDDIHQCVARIHGTGSQNIRFSVNYLGHLDSDSKFAPLIRENYGKWLQAVSLLSHFAPSRTSGMHILRYLKDTVHPRDLPRFAEAWAKELSDIEREGPMERSEDLEHAIRFVSHVHDTAKSKDVIVRPQHYFGWIRSILSHYENPEFNPYVRSAMRAVGDVLSKKDDRGRFVFERISENLRDLLEQIKHYKGQGKTLTDAVRDFKRSFN